MYGLNAGDADIFLTRYKPRLTCRQGMYFDTQTSSCKQCKEGEYSTDGNSSLFKLKIMEAIYGMKEKGLLIDCEKWHLSGPEEAHSSPKTMGGERIQRKKQGEGDLEIIIIMHAGDFTFLGDPEFLIENFEIIVEEFPKVCLKVRPSKMKLLLANAPNTSEHFESWKTLAAT